MRPDHAVSFADYLQYARLGLVEAIDGFDPTREASFETYSSYRSGAPCSMAWRARAKWRPRERSGARGLEERVEQLGPPQSLGCGARARRAHAHARGLGEQLFDERDDLVDDAPHSNPHTATELAQLREAVEKLPDRERLVIRRHYFDHREFRVIARELTITPGRVSQLHAQALGHIRLLLDLE